MKVVMSGNQKQQHGTKRNSMGFTGGSVLVQVLLGNTTTNHPDSPVFIMIHESEHLSDAKYSTDVSVFMGEILKLWKVIVR